MNSRSPAWIVCRHLLCCTWMKVGPAHSFRRASVRVHSTGQRWCYQSPVVFTGVLESKKKLWHAKKNQLEYKTDETVTNSISVEGISKYSVHLYCTADFIWVIDNVYTMNYSREKVKLFNRVKFLSLKVNIIYNQTFIVTSGEK